MNRKMASIASICVAGAIFMAYIPVQAAENKMPLEGLNNTVSTEETMKMEPVKESVMEPIGAAVLFEAVKTEEEYINTANNAVGAKWGYTDLGISNVDNNLNIRQSPDETSKLVGKLPQNAACEILQVNGEWVQIKSGKVEGYVKREFLLTGWNAQKRAKEAMERVAIVTTDNLKVRNEPNTESEVVTMVAQGEELNLVEELDGWVKVELDAEEQFVASDYVKVEEKLKTAITLSEIMYGQGVSDIRIDLVKFAKEFIGNPYVWGGVSLTKGADCSGFTMSVFKNFGITIPRTSAVQANYGTKIEMADAKPGDLIFYAKGGRVNHVALYIGNGQVVHASSPKTGIKISQYNYRTPYKVMRVLQD